MAAIHNITITEAGREAALNADNDGLELKLTHVSLGGGQYDPTGLEVALLDQYAISPIAGGGRVSTTQLRLSAFWSAESGTYPIGELGFWAGEVLFAIWSKADETVAGVKTPGVDFVLFYDMSLSGVPGDSVNILIDPDASAALAALSAHEVADNAHPQYVRHDAFPDAQANLWAETVGGTDSAIALTMPENVEVDAYKKGQAFTFQATARNTAAVTVAINGLAPVPVLKNGVDPLSPGDIVEEAVYHLLHDGTSFHITGGVGGADCGQQAQRDR